ncbi:alpha/beta hydrolase [Candidatus Profftella armatura]|uniref:alpha/beta hydrolase n=1 Tax=Candidatus Profftella armatura TaxID=669502 RepID=UPI003D96DDDA
MISNTKFFNINGSVGILHCAINFPSSIKLLKLKGVVLIAHPHPLFGGTMDNKVVQTLVRVMLSLGYISIRMNFRGVGASSGTYDSGNGETDDMEILLRYIQKKYPYLPIILAGFSFGTFVQAKLQKRLDKEISIKILILISVAVKKWLIPEVPKNTIIIHGELDEIIPLKDVFLWANPLDIPVVVIPGGGHFFHKKLHHIKNIITHMLYSY